MSRRMSPETPVAQQADIIRQDTHVVVVLYAEGSEAIAAVMDHREAQRFASRIRKAANDSAVAAARARGG